MSDFWQILCAAAGSLGFGLMFRVRAKRLGWAALGGGLTWAVYLLCVHAGMNGFFANLLATVFAAAWAEVLAHLCRAPAVIFTVTALIPLIPGGMLYKTMRAVVDQDPAAASLGVETALTAGAIAFGMLLVAAGMHIFAQYLGKQKKH